MAVNLTGIELGGPAAGSTRKTSSTHSPVSGSEAQDSAPATAEVNITSTAALLAQLEQSLAAQPAVDASRVTAVSQAIAAGRYQASAGEIASGLMQAERALSPLPLAEI